MNKATQQNVVFGLNKKSKMSLAYRIAGFYTDENLIGEKNWHSLMWLIFGQLGKTYSNDPEDPRPSFTSVDNDKIRAFTEISDFEEAYPQVAKLAKAKADLFNSTPQEAPKAELPTVTIESDLEARMDKIEAALTLIVTKLS